MVELSPTFRSPARGKRTTVISRKPSSNFWHAFNLADDLGTPFNVLVTTNFALTKCPPEHEVERFCLLLNRYFMPWWRRPSRRLKMGPTGPAAFVWVAEAGGGCVAIHFAAHIPKNRLTNFVNQWPKWVGIVTGGITDPRARDIREAGNPLGLRKYLLKGTHPAYAAFCNIDHVPQGSIVGKRSGFSRSLGPKSRERHNYVPRSQRRRGRAWWS